MARGVAEGCIVPVLFAGGFVFSIVASAVIGCSVGSESERESLLREAQERGYAERYIDQQTGKHGWRWSGDAEPTEFCPSDSCGCVSCDCDADSRCEGCDCGITENG